MLGNHEVVDLSKAYELIAPITNAFRASGRFIWPAYYVVITISVVSAARLTPRGRTIALALALVLQVYDGHRGDQRAAFSLGAPPPPPSVAWQLADRHYTRLFIDPPDIQGGFAQCDEIRNTPGSYLPLARIAMTHHFVFNSGITSRFDEARTLAACTMWKQRRQTGQFDRGAIYAPEPHVKDAYLLNTAMTCGTLDARLICVRTDEDTAFARFLVSSGARSAASDISGAAAFVSGFTDPSTSGARWAGGHAVLRLRGNGSPHWLSAFARMSVADTGARTGIIRVDGKERLRQTVRNGTLSGYFFVGSQDTTEVEFDVLAGDGGPVAGNRVFELWRLEWVSTDGSGD